MATLSSVIVSQTFDKYANMRTAELSALVKAGIIASDSNFAKLASAPSTTANMPYFADLTGASSPVVEGATLTPGLLASKLDVAAIIRRAASWKSSDLDAALSGADPAKEIADRVAAFWARDMQAELLAELAGVFGAASMAGLLHDISAGVGAAGVWSGSAFADATQKLGDAKGILTSIAMHSATETLLSKQNLIVTNVLPSENGLPVPSYGGKRVIVDDSCPVNGANYTSYLFGQGAVALGIGSPSGETTTEVVRQGLDSSGVDVLVNRKTFILHPRGVKYTGAVQAADTPTRVELANQANWVRAYDVKQLRIVAFIHKIA